MNIEGKVIVITGAARGIGQEYARYLGSQGARIVIADITDCTKTLDLVKAAGAGAAGFEASVPARHLQLAFDALLTEVGIIRVNKKLRF